MKSIQCKIGDQAKVKSLSFEIEEKLNKLYGNSASEYSSCISVLSSELAKSLIQETDVAKIAQSKLSDLDLYLSTLKKPKYFIL